MSLTKIKKIFLFFLFYLFIDYCFSHFILKKTNLWKQATRPDFNWRLKSDIYDHDFKPNVNVIEPWQNFKKKIITNSIGFRDKQNKLISKKNITQKRILLLGDSFIEGMGYDYEDTLAGKIQSYFGDKVEILNAAVSSYSAGPYYLKTKYYLDQGYVFDQAIVFLDVSDIYDELFYQYSNNNDKIINHEINKKKTPIHKKIFYSLGQNLTENTILFRVLLKISDQTEIYKNYIKLKYKASKEFGKNFFQTTQEDTLFYRMLSIDRGAWTFNDLLYEKIIPGLKKTDFFLKKLFLLFEKNKIKSTLIIYPWPNQIYFGDAKHQVYWEKFSKNNNINFINLYNEFRNNNKKKLILENFIKGDVHWNENGTEKIFRGLIKSKLFDE